MSTRNPGQATREEQVRIRTERAALVMTKLAEGLAFRQVTSGATRGAVPAWAGCDDIDFGGTLAAVWIWQRVQGLTGVETFVPHVNAGWAFVRSAWSRFIPRALGAAAGDEAPYDCAMVLKAGLAARDVGLRDEFRQLPEVASRLLAAHLSDLEDQTGREYSDPGFLAWTLAEYARASDDRGLLSAARRFVDRAFGMKVPPRFSDEPAATGGLFDFSSSTATRILAVVGAEGATPFVGAWLRERVAPMAPKALIPRATEENSWNACVAACLGRSFVVATDPSLLRSYDRLMAELESRGDKGGLGRAPGFPDETRATFYYGLALDSVTQV